MPVGNALQWPEVGQKCNEPCNLASGVFSPASGFHLALTTSELASSKLSGCFVFDVPLLCLGEEGSLKVSHREMNPRKR